MTKITRISSLVLLAALYLVAVAKTSAQGIPAIGVPPFASASSDGGPEIINRANLNVMIPIPIFHKAGRGLPTNYNLVYNGLVWYPSGPSGNQYWTPVPGSGWQVPITPSGSSAFMSSTAATWPSVVGSLAVVNSYSYICSYSPWEVYFNMSNFVYTDPSGTPHPFPNATLNIACNGTVTGNTTTSSDGSGYQLNTSTSNKYTGLGETVTTPSGTQMVLGSLTGLVAGTAMIMDTNGNQITEGTNSSGSATVTDTLGTTTITVTGGTDTNGTPPTTLTLAYTAPSGAGASYTIKWVSAYIRTNFGCSGIHENNSNLWGPLISEIDLPDGTKYTFTYEPTPGYSSTTTGRIASMTLPTGGTISYVYSGGSNGINCADGSTATLTRYTPDGTWTYAHSGATTTITVPQMPYDSASNQQVYTFNSSGRETQHKWYQGGASGGTLLRTVNTTWASNNTPATQITILEDNSTQSEVETTYDNYGNLQVMKEHDFGTGAPGSVLRTTNYTYLSASTYTNRNIVDRVTERAVVDSTGTVQYREDTAYDGTTISPCPTGVPMHDDTGHGCSFATRGNPTSFTVYTNAAAPSGGVTRNSYFDVFGNEVQADSDSWQSLQRTYSATTQYSAPDSVVRGSNSGPQLTTKYAYNAYTDQLASITDPNNQVISYTYDSMLRQLSVTRPDNSQITTVYNDTGKTLTTTEPIDSTHSRVKVGAFDGLGRISTTTVEDASSNVYSISQTQYDPAGRPYKQSNPYTSSPQYWVTNQFDGLERTTKTILQDSSQTSYSYSLVTVTSTDPANHQRKVKSDGLGRATTFFEPDPTNNNSLTLQTTYVYSVLNKAATITQGSQTRSFNYDGIGRLTSETHPENGTTGYQYNSFHKLTQRTDNRGVITSYSYDNLNRLTQGSYNVGSTGVPATPTVSYSYGTNTSQLNNGRLLTVTDGTGSKTYAYDVTARLTQEAQVINGTQYTIAYGYNLAGERTSITYPWVASSSTRRTLWGVWQVRRPERPRSSMELPMTPVSRRPLSITATGWPSPFHTRPTDGRSSQSATPNPEAHFSARHTDTGRTVRMMVTSRESRTQSIPGAT